MTDGLVAPQEIKWLRVVLLYDLKDTFGLLKKLYIQLVIIGVYRNHIRRLEVELHRQYFISEVDRVPREFMARLVHIIAQLHSIRDVEAGH